MIYKPRSHTHNRKKIYNWSSTVEIAIGIIAWVFVCAISWWAIYLMLEAYTE